MHSVKCNYSSKVVILNYDTCKVYKFTAPYPSNHVLKDRVGRSGRDLTYAHLNPYSSLGILGIKTYATSKNSSYSYLFTDIKNYLL